MSKRSKKNIRKYIDMQQKSNKLFLTEKKNFFILETLKT